MNYSTKGKEEMYKNLEQVLNDLNIKKKDLSDELHYDYQKYLTQRISYNAKFTEEEKEIIFRFLQLKGYKGGKDYLFDRTEYIKTKKEKQENSLSRILNEEMKKQHLTNKELAEKILISENTISNWRNGKVKNIKDKRTYIQLAEALNISASRLMGFDSIFDDYKSWGYESRSIKKNEVIEKIYDILIKYQKTTLGYKNLDVNPIYKQSDLYPLIKRFIADFNEKIKDRYASSPDKLLQLNNYKDFHLIIMSITEELNAIKNEIQEEEQKPFPNKELLEQKKHQYDLVRNEYDKALQIIDIYKDEETENGKE